MALHRSFDRKVSALIRRQGSKDSVVIGNSFGLPGGPEASCPGATAFCKGCYAIRTEIVFPSAGKLVQRNFDTLLAYGDDVAGMADELLIMLAEFNREFDKALKAGRVTEADRIFRIHWDGDFYSLAYAQAWAIAARTNSFVQFWAYTRSFDFVGALVGIENLTLYLSVDEYNALAANVTLDRYPSLLVAACADTQIEAQSLVIRPRKIVACPENVKRIPLVVAMSGKRSDPIAVGDDAQGACSACMLCVNGTRDVGFAMSKS